MSTARSRVITRTLAATAVVLATGGAATLGAVDPAGATPAPTSQALRAHPGTQPPVSRGGHDLAPVLGRSARGAVDGRYIVVMQDRAGARTTRTARQVAVSRGGKVLFDYRSALTGFAARLPDRAVRALRHDRNVAYLEVDHRVSIDGDQSGATWGLDRVDQRSLPLSSSYHYDQTGSGVRAYIVDTGVLTTHTEFTGRTATGYSAISGGTTDCNGHGTHVAGTVGGTTYGVAKGVTIVPVRVLDCSGSGTDSGVIAGVDWVTSNHTSGQPAVANMSLGGGASSALDTAVTNAVNDGVVFAVAAGNDNADACNGSPSRVASAVTVGATTSSDARASYSNYGSCLDLFAPGSNITSAWYTSTTATNTISGTSMATPHVTGAAALYLQAHPSASPATVASWLTSNATSGVVTSPGTGSPNRLLYTLEGGGTTPPPTGNLLVNPGFESGATGWSASSGVITNDTGRPARTGSWKAWLCGYGSTHTDTLSQSVTLPSTATTLSFYLRIDTSETTTSTAYDKLSVQVVSGGTTTTLATYSNLNATSSYVQRSFSLAAYAGKTVTIKLTGTEDASLQTSFVVDDTSIG